jgi:diacylglycerol kinase family enzyme
VSTERIALVVNPSATRTDGAVRGTLGRALAPHGLMDIAVPRGPGETAEAVVRAVADGATTVAVLGGDGTQRVAAAVLAGGPVALLPLPGGSTNVLARGLGWPQDIGRAAAMLGAAFATPPRELVVGRAVADGREELFLVNCGTGVDAAAADWVERHTTLKHRLRQGAFAIGVAGPGVRAIVAGPALTLTAGATPEVGVSSFIAACGGPYAYLGARPLDLLPRAAWDGRLEWIALSGRSPVAAARLLTGALRGGRHLADGGAVGGIGPEPLTLRAARPVVVQADGDPIGRVGELTLSPGPVLRVRDAAVTRT